MKYGPSLPLKRSDVDGFDMLKDGKRLISFHLKNLLFTSPGEKIEDPAYGIGIRRFLFEPLTPSSVNIIKGEIETQISVNLSYLNLKSVDIDMDEEGSSISVSIKYQVAGTNFSDVAQYDVSLKEASPSNNLY